MKRVLGEISFSANEQGKGSIVIDVACVRARVEDLSKDQNLSRFIL